jgi:polysaccharide biosynthesis protein PslH
MNILFLSTWFPYPPDNGSKLRVYHLLRSLKRDHRVSLLSFTFDTAKPENPGPLRQRCEHIETLEIDPFAVNQAGALATFLSASPVAARPVPAMSQRMTEIVRKQPFDVVIASTEMMATYALQAPPAATKILEEHNSLTRWMQERYASQKRFDQKLRCWASWQKSRRYEAHLFGQFDLITMVSEGDQAVCLADLPGYQGRVEVIPNGVDCQHNRPGLAGPRPDALVFNGSLTYNANFDAMRWFLAEVYPRIRARVPGVSLTITGSTHGVDLAGLALDDTVRLTGSVDDVRIPVAAAGACVVPIRQGGGTRLKILEAMALGTPVVTTSKGAEGLDVTDGKHLLLADNPEAFAMHTVGLLGNPALRHDLATNARQLVEDRYDWATIGQRFVDLVEAAVKEKIQRTA